jgi:predicted metal-dependent HD superfamily phosphohydrolase
VKQLILVTKHIKDSENNDEKYIMDIDKAILGKNPRIYNQYVKDVRREYYMYSDEQFKK